ncbi:MAG: methyltransferase domain-containing protein [Anaerolineaceae bacterium]|nr:methyltransferase domain-containing protein [Anaerolineaceae bacterium]
MLQKLLDLNGQYRRPSGLIGRWVGGKMADQHRAENLWTVAHLHVQPTDKLLEVGFGPGFAIQEIVPHLTTGSIAGVDFSQTMVRSAKRRNARAVQAGLVDVRYGEVRQLPFADSVFDKAFSINSIYFWIDALTAFQELRRVLKTSGWLSITFLPSERWDSTPTATEDFKPYSSVEVQSLFSEAGFINLRVEADPNLQNRANYSIIGQKG